MTRRLVCLGGSPRPGTSVSRLLAACAAGAREAGADVDAFDAYAMHVRACIACGPDATPGWCVFHDDMDPLYAALERAHAVIVGTPVYFDGVSGPLKLVMDRCNCLTPLVTLPDGRQDTVARWARTRRGAFVGACSDAHDPSMAERSVRGFLKWAGAKWEQSVIWKHADNDEGSVPASLLDEARVLGRRLMESEPLAP